MGSFEPLMDFNLPELLVGDLEESKDVFKSRQLTAGAPAPSLAGDGSKRRYSLQDSSLSAAHSSNLLDTMWKAKSLQNVNETQSHFFTIRGESHRNRSDSDSASSESSCGLMPPSIGTRDASIATTATSVTSERLGPQNQLKKLRLVIQDRKQAGQSWIDLDAEDPTSPDRRYSMINIPSPAQYLSLRHDLDESRSMSLNSVVLRRPNSTSSPPTSPKVSSKSSPKASPKMSPGSVKSSGAGEQRNRVGSSLTCPTPPPERRSSLMHRNYPVLPKINVSPSLQVLSSQPLSTQREDATSSPDRNMPLLAPLQPSRKKADDVSNERDASKAGFHLPEADIERDEPGQYSHAESTEYPEIAAAGVDVESWLESSVDNFPYYAQNRADGGHMPLPLPPDVIDTLRISITCFPETMLQCSSLSIETIRGHSRKLRYKSSSPASIYAESPVSVDSSDQSKQTKWKWLPMLRQQSSPTEAPTSPQRTGFGESLEPKYSPVWPKKPDWTTIQNLFPSGSDYLCDALYAHLVAYNYITSLCPRSVLINTTTSRPTSKSSTTPSELSLGLSVDLRTSVDIRASTDGGSIPRKAANLLGLQEDPNAPIPEPPSSRCNTLRTKRSFFTASRVLSYYEVSRPTTAAGSSTGRRIPQPDQGEQVLKDLRLGLARCISRLVATLRTTNGSRTGPDGAGQMKREEDPDFMRALCEIVRLSEERYM
ncbi:hypothetical protein F4813DRAFT_236566 [Daldinia decipiens]|uniref:uncharacterized protein n=1 Tax=Daldinia decipiens TaxID=326647 RepID=UPI0020C2AC0A|nr:uncharacterized protein F4813DRAFT_236566 [Daldinia decipiens]KAI1654126.1 hypothetical protein F4813DRAFT_236566 [Daldinia decipiens]